MRKLIHFVGMKRSGNHAVIPWMQNNIFSESDNSTVIHINDVYPAYGESPNLSRPPGVRIVSSAPNLVAILSYEDSPLGLIPRLPTVARSHEVMEDANVQTMLLLRDPYNAFASRYARLHNSRNDGFAISVQRQEWSETIELWKSYAREFAGQTQTLGGIIPVNYDRWVADKGYRDRFLSDHFGQEENLDRGIEEVGEFGNGSSIDGFKYSGQATEMDVLGRWKLFQYDQSYRDLFKDRELRELSEEIFHDFIGGTEIIHNNFFGRERK